MGHLNKFQSSITAYFNISGDSNKKQFFKNIHSKRDLFQVSLEELAGCELFNSLFPIHLGWPGLGAGVYSTQRAQCLTKLDHELFRPFKVYHGRHAEMRGPNCWMKR